MGWGGLSLIDVSKCQKDVKYQKVKHADYGGGSQKKINWHNEVHRYWCQFWCQIWNCPKILSMDILRVFSDHHMWHQNWHQYVWTSLCQFIFFVHLLHSLGVWFFDIWQKDVQYVPHCSCALSPLSAIQIYALLCPVPKDPCRTRMHPCTHLDLLGISQNLFATAIFMVSSNAIKKIQIAWH